MEEKRLKELLREVIGEVFEEKTAIFATKDDLRAFTTKDDLKAFATKDDLKAFATKDDLKAFATKDDLKAFATKDDLKAFATKDDLKAFATKDDLKAFITKEEFLEFERRLTNALNGIREGVRLSLYEIEKRLGEIESKLRFYDFNFVVNQNDAIMRTMKDIYIRN